MQLTKSKIKKFLQKGFKVGRFRVKLSWCAKLFWKLSIILFLSGCWDSFYFNGWVACNKNGVHHAYKDIPVRSINSWAGDIVISEPIGVVLTWADAPVCVTYFYQKNKVTGKIRQ